MKKRYFDIFLLLFFLSIYFNLLKLIENLKTISNNYFLFYINQIIIYALKVIFHKMKCPDIKKKAIIKNSFVPKLFKEFLYDA